LLRTLLRTLLRYKVMVQSYVKETVMIKKTATIVKINDQAIWVNTNRQTTCGSCVASQGCGVSILDKYFDKRGAQASVRLGAYKSEDFRLGDNIIIGLPQRTLIKSSLLIYFLPLVFMIGFSLFGQFIASAVVVFNEESLSIIFAFIGLVLGFLFVNFISKKIINNIDFKAKLIGVSD